VLGYEVEGTDADGQAAAQPSIENVNGMIDRDGVQFFTGGISSTVTIACMDLAQQNKVPYSGPISTSGGISGGECSRYYFHNSVHSEFLGRLAGRLLPDLAGEERSFFQIYVDYSYGHSNRDAFSQYMTEQGWEDLGGVGISTETTDHTSQIAELEDSGADFLMFTSFGGLAQAGIQQMQDTGILEEIDVWVPHLTDFTFEPSGDECQGVMGGTTWHKGGDVDNIDAFVDAYESEYSGEPATQSAMLAYQGVLQWAANCEATNTMHPPTVIENWETYSANYGTGQIKFRECDHTAERPVFAVQALAPENRGDLGLSTELLDQTEPFIYECDVFPASECDMDANPYE